MDIRERGGGRDTASVANIYQIPYTKTLKIITFCNIYNSFQHWHCLHFGDKAMKAVSS